MPCSLMLHAYVERDQAAVNALANRPSLRARRFGSDRPLARSVSS
jgi:hypothetical protein